MSEKIGHFEICREMAKRGMDIRMSLLENVTNLSYSKRTKGTTVSIGVDGNIVGDIFHNKFIGGLLLCDKEQYFAVQKELEGASDSAEAGNSCLQTPGTCESCPDWFNRPKRRISAFKESGTSCTICGKNTVRRTRKSPAPIRLIAGPIACSLCMTCAKQISNRLDTIIAAIEERYGRL